MGNYSDKLGDYDCVLVVPSLSLVADEGFSLARKEGVRFVHSIYLLDIFILFLDSNSLLYCINSIEWMIG